MKAGRARRTLMSLLPRFYDVQGGQILLNGRNLRDIDLTSLRSTLAIVPQEPVLFTGSIRENIQYGRRDATEEQICEAAAPPMPSSSFLNWKMVTTQPSANAASGCRADRFSTSPLPGRS